MDEVEVELSDHGLLLNPESSGNAQGSASIDSYLDEFLNNTRTCTHTHTCNPPGPDSTHTHTCYHSHTQVFPPGEDGRPLAEKQPMSKPRRPSGNREAVRKYREKRKAHTAYLEEEVKKLRLLNQQLVKKLQGQAALEAEILRLRGLLVDLRGKIDNELGAFPFLKLCNNAASLKEGDCGLLPSNGSSSMSFLQCENGIPCFHPHLGTSLQAGSSIGGSEKIEISWEAGCQPMIGDCSANTSYTASVEGCPKTLVTSTSQAE